MRARQKKKDQGPRRQNFAKMTDAASEIVRQAADLLDQEIAAGILAAKAVEDRFVKERRLHPTDVLGSLDRFRSMGHEILQALTDRVAQIAPTETTKPITHLLERGHDLLDLAVGMIESASKMAEEAAPPQSKNTQPSEGPTSSSPGPSTGTRTAMRLQIHAGDSSAIPLRFTNVRDEPFEISLAAESLFGTKGTRISADCVTFESAKVRVAPRSQSIASATIAIPVAAKPDSYVARIRIDGGHVEDVIVVIDVLPRRTASPRRSRTSSSKLRTSRARSARP